MQNKKMRQSLAWLLTAAMLLGAAPSAAFAEEAPAAQEILAETENTEEIETQNAEVETPYAETEAPVETEVPAAETEPQTAGTETEPQTAGAETEAAAPETQAAEPETSLAETESADAEPETAAAETETVNETETEAQATEDVTEEAVSRAQTGSVTYTGDYGLISLTVNPKAGEELPAADAYEVKFTPYQETDSNDITAAAKTALEAAYDGVNTFFVIRDLHLENTQTGERAELPKDASYSFKTYAFGDTATAFVWEDSALTLLGTLNTAGTVNAYLMYDYVMEMDHLSDIVLATSALTEKEEEKQTVTYTSSEGMGLLQLTVTADADVTLPSADAYFVETEEAGTGVTEAVQKLLNEKYTGAEDFSVLYRMHLENSAGEEATLPKGVTYRLRISTINPKATVFAYENSELTLLTELNAAGTQDTFYDYTVSVGSLSSIVLVKSTLEKNDHVPAYGKIEAGTYTVTANLFVPGTENVVLKGVTAYLTNPSMPPTEPVSLNAVMTVDENGRITLKLPVVNKIFTLQQIEDGTDVHILDSKYGADEGAAADSYGPYSGRYQELTVSVDNLNGEYAFTNCKEYPLILLTDKTMPIHLRVDFDSARRNFTPVEGKETYTRVFADEENGISLKVETTEEQLGLAISSADTVFSVRKAEGEDKQTAMALLADNYLGTPTADVYEISLKDGEGTELSFDGNTQVTAEFSGNIPENPMLWYLGGQKPETLNASLADGTYSLILTHLGTFAVVDEASAAQFIKKTVADEETGACATIYDATIYDATNMAFLLAGAKIGVKRSEEGGEIIWKFSALMEDGDDYYLANQYETTRTTKHVYTLPLKNAGDTLYMVVDTGSTAYRKKLGNAGEDGTFTFTLSTNIGEENDYDTQRGMYNAYAGMTASADKPAVYFIETGEKTVVPESVASYGDPLVYNGREQTGIKESALYTVTGNKAVDAGVHTATLTLTEEAVAAGYTWADGSAAPKEVTWEIKQKEVTVSLNVSGTVPSTAQVKLLYEGWIEGENEVTEKDGLPTAELHFYTRTLREDGSGVTSSLLRTKGFQDNVLEDTLYPGMTYWLSFIRKSGGNYSYRQGEQWQFTVEGVSVPESAALTYTGTKQRGIPESPYYTVVSGDAEATDAGTYTAVLSLNYIEENGEKLEQLQWNRKTGDGLADESTENSFHAAYKADVTITWTIEKAPLTAAYAGETVTAGQTPALKVDVTGFVNGETAETAKEYEAPTIAKQSGLEAGMIRTLAPVGGSAKNYTFVNYVPGVLNVTAAKTEDSTEKKDSGTDTPATETPVTETPSTEEQATKSQLKVKKTSITKTYGAKAFKLGATAQGKLTYKSSNTKIARVSSSGTVTIKGTGTVTITVKAAKKGVYKAETKKIKLTVKPKKATLTKVKAAAKNKTVIRWKKDKKATGYQLQYAANKKFTSEKKTLNVKKYSTVSKTLRKLKSKKTYYVRVRAYKTSNGKKIYGAWSAVKKVKTK